MPKLLSNEQGNLMISQYERLVNKSNNICVAAPYVTDTAVLAEVARRGGIVQLLVGLNDVTQPEALDGIRGLPGISIRYYTSKFHAKIYLFDTAAAVGSSNLTSGGLWSNREANLLFDEETDTEVVQELRAYFNRLFEDAEILSPDVFLNFQAAHIRFSRGADLEARIEAHIGKVVPSTGAQMKKAKAYLYERDLRRKIEEEYRPAFEEVTNILLEYGLRRSELVGLDSAEVTNRFLNWVRLVHAPGGDWKQVEPIADSIARRAGIVHLAREWVTEDDGKIPDSYWDWLTTVRRTFGSAADVNSADKDQLTEGLFCIHAFASRIRFHKTGRPGLTEAFWQGNSIDKVRTSLIRLLHSSDDYVKRLHDVLYDSGMHLAEFGQFCAIELLGTIRPSQCPPVNGRIAKGLRRLGYKVQGD